MFRSVFRMAILHSGKLPESGFPAGATASRSLFSEASINMDRFRKKSRERSLDGFDQADVEYKIRIKNLLETSNAEKLFADDLFKLSFLVEDENDLALYKDTLLAKLSAPSDRGWVHPDTVGLCITTFFKHCYLFNAADPAYEMFNSAVLRENFDLLKTTHFLRVYYALLWNCGQYERIIEGYGRFEAATKKHGIVNAIVQAALYRVGSDEAFSAASAMFAKSVRGELAGVREPVHALFAIKAGRPALAVDSVYASRHRMAGSNVKIAAMVRSGRAEEAVDFIGRMLDRRARPQRVGLLFEVMKEVTAEVKRLDKADISDRWKVVLEESRDRASLVDSSLDDLVFKPPDDGSFRDDSDTDEG